MLSFFFGGLIWPSLVQTLYCCDRLPISLCDGYLQHKCKHGQGFVSGRVHENIRAWSGMGGDGASKGPVCEAHADMRLKMHCDIAVISTCFSFKSSGEEEITVVVQGG